MKHQTSFMIGFNMMSIATRNRNHIVADNASTGVFLSCKTNIYAHRLKTHYKPQRNDKFLPFAHFALGIFIRTQLLTYT
jgi:hypothetical protein